MKILNILAVGILGALALLPMTSSAQTANAPTSPKSPATSVLAISRPVPGVDRAKLMEVLPLEVRATAKLYLDGKILAWYSKKDSPGVVFQLNCATVEEAQTILAGLPLHEAKLMEFEFIPLGPLEPLRLLANTPVEKR